MNSPVTIEFWVEPLFNCIGIDLCLCGAEWKSKIWHHHIRRPPCVLVFILYIFRWSLLHVRWSTLSGWSLVSLSFGKEQVLPIANICDFSRRERRAIEAFEKRSSGGGGVGQILFNFHCQTHFHCIVVEGGLVKLFSTKIAKMFAKDIPCHIPLFSTTLISYHHVVECFRLARFEAGSILKGKRIKTTRCR